MGIGNNQQTPSLPTTPEPELDEMEQRAFNPEPIDPDSEDQHLMRIEIAGRILPILLAREPNLNRVAAQGDLRRKACITALAFSDELLSIANES